MDHGPVIILQLQQVLQVFIVQVLIHVINLLVLHQILHIVQVNIHVRIQILVQVVNYMYQVNMHYMVDI